MRHVTLIKGNAAALENVFERAAKTIRFYCICRSVYSLAYRMRYSYATYDVFTQTALAGNPLAIVFEADSLDAVQMQALAREFNLSETIFVLSPRDSVQTARVRIFTPVAELPFAGHPLIGGAIAIAQMRAADMAGARDLTIALETEIGLIPCTVRLERKGVSYAYFELLILPRKIADADPADLAQALGLPVEAIGFDRHRPTVYSAGAAFCFAPVKDRAALLRARYDPRHASALLGALGVCVYTRDTVKPDSAAHMRVFAPGLGVVEDAATGGAAAAFAGAAVEFEAPNDGEHHLRLEQGFEMGRPSYLNLSVNVENGRIVSATLGGFAVGVATGTLFV